MTFGCARYSVALLVTALPLCFACGTDDPAPGNQSGGTGGTGVMAGTGGSAGSTAGKAGANQGGAGAGGTAGAGVAGGGRGGAGAAGKGGAGASSGGAGSGAGGRGGAGAGGMPVGGAGAGGMGGASGGMSGSGAGGAGAGAGGSGGAGAFTLTNPDFMNMAGCSKDMAMSCAAFPCDLASYMMSPNISPELSWTGTPAGTMSFAIVLSDLTSPNAHWAIWNIPGSATMVAKDIDKDTAMPAVPAGSQQTNATFANSTTMDGYFGPGSASNVYEFVLYALSVAKFTPASTTDANAVRTALDGAGSMVLGKASLRGRQNYNEMCN